MTVNHGVIGSSPVRDVLKKMVKTGLESRFIENNPLRQLKRDHLINKIAIGITAAEGLGLLIYGFLANDNAAKISSYICSAVIFAITALGYFSIYKPMAERIENYERILEYNRFLR